MALLFAASGAAGLCHEVAWARSLGLTLGSSLQALTAVLVAFLGGLGLGAIVGARIGTRWRSPLAGYATLEIIVGLWGVVSPAMARLPARLLEDLGPSFGGGGLALLRLALALIVLLPPTIAMGATLPVLARAALGGTGPSPLDRAGAGEALAVLYGSNTLGGAVGAFFGSFVLLPLLGTRLTFAVAAALNLLIGLAAIALDRLSPRASPTGASARSVAEPRPAPTTREAPTAPCTAPVPLVAASAAALSGLGGAMLQIGWTRVAALSFGSTVYALGSALTAYILGLGAGPLLARRIIRRADPARSAAALQAIVGFSSIFLLPALGRLPVLAAVVSGRLSDGPGLMVVVAFGLITLLLLPPTLAQGASFVPLALLAGGKERADRSAGLVFAASTWGSVLGFLASGFVSLPRLGTHTTLAAASILALVLAAALTVVSDAPPVRPPGTPAPEDSSGRRPRRRVASWATAASLVAAGPLLLLILPAWDSSLMTSGGFLYGPVYRAALGDRRLPEAMRRRGTILFERDGGSGLVTVRKNAAGVLSLQINGKTEASTGGDLGTQLLAAHLPLLAHPGPSSVLVIGLASGITVGAAETHPVKVIRVVEITPAVTGAARFFDDENHRALDDPRVDLILDDARSWLLARPERYDVIASQPSNPWVAGVSNLFTVEFYRLARRRLCPGGIFCQWVQAYRLTPRDLRGIVRSFLTVFPAATLWEESAGGGDYFLLGGARAPAIDPGRLGGSGLAAVRGDLRRAGIESPADLLARFVSGPKGLSAFAAGARPLTDDDLYLEWSAPLALFRDTLREQVTAIGRYREPPLSVVDPAAVAREPDLVTSLERLLRLRDERLQLLDSLREADLWALRDPFLAAGIEFLRAGRFTEAAAALTRGESANPGSAGASLLLAEAYRGAGLVAAASVAYRQATERDPSLAAAWNGLGRCLASEGRRRDARSAFERALQADPRLASARNNLGAVLLQEDDLEGAELAFRAALAADPGLAPARANLGVVLKRRGDRRGAEEAYRAALDLDPMNADARYDLAVLLKEAARPDEARRELLNLLRIDPGDDDAAAALREINGVTGTRRERARASPLPPPA